MRDKESETGPPALEWGSQPLSCLLPPSKVKDVPWCSEDSKRPERIRLSTVYLQVNNKRWRGLTVRQALSQGLGLRLWTKSPCLYMLTVQRSRSPGHTQSSVVPVTAQRPLGTGANSPQAPSSPEYTVMSCLSSCSHRGARSSTTPANFWIASKPKLTQMGSDLALDGGVHSLPIWRQGTPLQKSSGWGTRGCQRQRPPTTSPEKKPLPWLPHHSFSVEVYSRHHLE